MFVKNCLLKNIVQKDANEDREPDPVIVAEGFKTSIPGPVPGQVELVDEQGYRPAKAKIVPVR